MGAAALPGCPGQVRGDRSSVTGGTKVLSDRIVIRITADPGQTFIDRMIKLIEGAVRQKTPNEIALHVLLVSLTIVFLAVTMAPVPFASLAGATPSPIVLVALLVCLIPTTIGALVPAIGIAGMDRLVQHNVLATSGRAVETAGDITTLLLDKTGTITYGNRRAVKFFPANGVDRAVLIEAARLSGLADDTPEGRSVVDLAADKGVTGPDLAALERGSGQLTVVALAEKHRVTIPRLLIEAALNEDSEKPVGTARSVHAALYTAAPCRDRGEQHQPDRTSRECDGGSAGGSCRFHRPCTRCHHPD